jgi:hypothetical protein
MERQPQPKIMTHASSNNKLEYLPNKTVILNLPFILTTKKELKIGMPYMFLEGQHINAVRLLKVTDTDGVVYIKIQNLQTLKVYTISWNLNYDGSYWLWSLTSYSFLADIFINS